jgi:mRNA degradation ribonuclease J1/J2
VQPGDRVVIAARVIPGNERRVYEFFEKFADRGIEVIEGARAPHVSGHGQAGDLELLLAAVRPKCFVAIHGNARNLRAHGALVKAGGLDPDRVVDLRDGSTLSLRSDGTVEHFPGVPALEPLAAFGEVVWFAKDVLHTRHRMAHGGALVITPSTIVQRGISPPLSDDLLAQIRESSLFAFKVAGTPDEPAAIKQLTKLFWRARRLPPEIILIPDTQTPTPNP